MKFHKILSVLFVVCFSFLSTNVFGQGLDLFKEQLVSEISDYQQESTNLDSVRKSQKTINNKSNNIVKQQNYNEQETANTTINEISKIEDDYNHRLQTIFFKEQSKGKRYQLDSSDEPEDISQKPLTQFGYDLFKNTSEEVRPFGSLFNSVRDEYVLGIGDELILTFRGQRSDTEVVTIDAEGKLVLQDTIPFVAAGRKFSDVKEQIKEQVAANLIKTEVFVSLGSVKDLSVVVAGEVEKAGVYSVSGVANLFDALLKSGGIKKTGSLRNIEIIRKGRSRKIDLYNLLLGKGDIKDVVLADGDKIVVPTIGKTIAVLGEVNRPAIYELKEKSIKADDALAFAGGSIRSNGYRYVSIAGNKEGLDVVSSYSDTSYAMNASDILLVLRLRDARTGVVSLEGHVNVEGAYPLNIAPKLSSIINGAEVFKDNPYLLFGVVQRRDNATLSRYFVPVNFASLLNDKEDISLEEGDKIIVFSKQDIEWLSSEDVQSVLSKKENKTDCGSLKQLQLAMRSSWTNRFAAATQAREKTEKEKREEKYKYREQKPEEFDIENRKNQDLEQEEYKQEAFCPQVFEKYPNLLSFILSNVVNVNGEVNFAGIYPITAETPISSLVVISGGLSPNADLSAIEVTTFSNRGETFNRQRIDATKVPLTEVFVAANDIVRFNQVFSNREDGTVYLAGEFKRPGYYTVKKGEKLSEIIKRAGGITNEAYTIGAVFTRESVREAEYKTIKTAINNMQSGFMHSMASMELKNVSPAAIVSMMSELKELMSDTEPLGRIVVEADPLKLEINPELDIVLQGGDKIYMPKRPNHVLISGDVLHSGAMQFVSGRSPKEYIKMAGGTTRSADKSRTFMITPNGTAKPISLSSWNFSKVNIPPGSTIFVPRDTAPLNFMVFTKDVLDIVSKAAVTAASIKVLNDD